MKKIDLLITTGNYKPDIGGPSTFLNGFEEFLKRKEINYILIAIVSQKNIISKDCNIIKIKREIPWLVRSFLTIILIVFYRYKCKYWLSNTLELEPKEIQLKNKFSMGGKLCISFIVSKAPDVENFLAI